MNNRDRVILNKIVDEAAIIANMLQDVDETAAIELPEHVIIIKELLAQSDDKF